MVENITAGNETTDPVCFKRYCASVLNVEHLLRKCKKTLAEQVLYIVDCISIRVARP